MKVVPVIVCLFCIFFVLRAEDVITMVNGNQITGIVISENPSFVVVEKSGIQLTLKRTKISSIERMGIEARKVALQERKAPRPHQEEYYSVSVRPMFNALGELDELKKQWELAVEKADNLERRLENTKAEIVQLDRKIKVGRKQIEGFAVDEQLSALAKNKQIEDHNRLVKQTNHFLKQIRSAISHTTSLKNQIDDAYLSAGEKRNLYVKRAQRAGNHWLLLEERMKRDASIDSKGFVELRSRMNAHPAAFEAVHQKNEPPYILTAGGNKKYTLPRAEDGHFYVTASLNQIQHVDFLIDTGATISLLPESTGISVGARRLGPAVKTKIADGRTVDMFPALIEEMEIYGQRFTNVVVGLMVEQGRNKIPNLLGMNVISKIPIELRSEGLVMTIDPDTK
ncbi:aspartyl protease family protein [Kiritimatiellaeota bacterium B1221]|nr:aspartyl protease family protein [Kiritimatiellaeota bacterium B1221]